MALPFHSVTDIAVRAAQIRVFHIIPPRYLVSPEFHLRKNKPEDRRMRLSSELWNLQCLKIPNSRLLIFCLR
ncbi:hypothetical protein M405DRAFT_811508 [Rhizopogon salebrosus TDB-379]|nr:hypothetical protein M405DRAFT_811508 [Rhizopogon salebrosus TDB-379]